MDVKMKKNLKAIQEMAEKNDGVIICPTNNVKYKTSEVTKIYLS